MHKVVNCNFRFLNRLFGSGLLFRRKRRALMNYNAGRQSEMNIPIPLQSIRDESSAIVARKMGLPVLLGKRGRTASYNDSLAQFVENLRQHERKENHGQPLDPDERGFSGLTNRFRPFARAYPNANSETRVEAFSVMILRLSTTPGTI